MEYLQLYTVPKMVLLTIRKGCTRRDFEMKLMRALLFVCLCHGVGRRRKRAFYSLFYCRIFSSSLVFCLSSTFLEEVMLHAHTTGNECVSELTTVLAQAGTKKFGYGFSYSSPDCLSGWI